MRNYMILSISVIIQPLQQLTLYHTGGPGVFYKLLILVSIITFLLQAAFQIYLAVVGNATIIKCEFLEILLRHVGFVRLDELE